MGARLLDGPTVAAAIREAIQPEVEAFTAAAGRPPGLGIVLVGDNPASEIYVGSKVKSGAEGGLRVDLERLPASATLEELLALVRRLNASAAHDGILVQAPLPAAMGKDAAQQVFDAIDPAKDVDGFHPHNAGLLFQGRPHLVPCTPAGVMVMLDHYGIRGGRRPRRRHRAKRDRRQADGGAAAAARRHGHDLPLEDTRPRRDRRRPPTSSSPRSGGPDS